MNCFLCGLIALCAKKIKFSSTHILFTLNYSTPKLTCYSKLESVCLYVYASDLHIMEKVKKKWMAAVNYLKLPLPQNPSSLLTQIKEWPASVWNLSFKQPRSIFNTLLPYPAMLITCQPTTQSLFQTHPHTNTLSLPHTRLQRSTKKKRTGRNKEAKQG